MLVREVIASALILLGRAELASALASGAGAEEEKDLTDTLLYCFNAVENEIARNYIPLVYREELLSKNNKFLYTSFSNTSMRREERDLTTPPILTTASVRISYLPVWRRSILT